MRARQPDVQRHHPRLRSEPHQRSRNTRSRVGPSSVAAAAPQAEKSSDPAEPVQSSQTPRRSRPSRHGSSPGRRSRTATTALDGGLDHQDGRRRQRHRLPGEEGAERARRAEHQRQARDEQPVRHGYRALRARRRRGSRWRRSTPRRRRPPARPGTGPRRASKPKVDEREAEDITRSHSRRSDRRSAPTPASASMAQGDRDGARRRRWPEAGHRGDEGDRERDPGSPERGQRATRRIHRRPLPPLTTEYPANWPWRTPSGLGYFLLIFRKSEIATHAPRTPASRPVGRSRVQAPVRGERHCQPGRTQRPRISTCHKLRTSSSAALSVSTVLVHREDVH